MALAARAGKAVLCTKPLGRTAEEARRMLALVEDAGVFAGYLEDLCYTPKTLKAIASVRDGAVGDVTWVRAREAHPGPHAAWFWDHRLTGGGAIIDLGCHCIEIIRNFVGKGNRPVEVMCWADTLVHPVEAEDNAVALVRFASGAMGQFEVSWTFRGGMDLRDEVAGTHGTIWLNHFLRTGYEMFTAAPRDGYVAEKAETAAGLAVPGRRRGRRTRVRRHVHRHVRRDGDRPTAAGDLLRRRRRQRRDGRRVSVGEESSVGIGACCPNGTAPDVPRLHVEPEVFEGQLVIKRELLPDGRAKLILRDPADRRLHRTHHAGCLRPGHPRERR